MIYFPPQGTLGVYKVKGLPTCTLPLVLTNEEELRMLKAAVAHVQARVDVLEKKNRALEAWNAVCACLFVLVTGSEQVRIFAPTHLYRARVSNFYYCSFDFEQLLRRNCKKVKTYSMKVKPL